MKQIPRRVRTTTTEETELEVDAADIRKWLGQAIGITIPDDATVTVSVPGGGDWSHATLDIDSRCPITVTWTKTTESGDGA